MTKGKKISTRSLVYNPAFRDRAVYSGQISVESLVSEVVEDVCQFHRYLERTLKDLDYDLCKRLYKKMETIAEKYPQNNSLKNKLDEASRRIWPHGRI